MNAIFVGEKRSGKTTLAFNMALQTDGGIIVFDPKKEFRDWPATVNNVESLQRAIDDKNRVIIYRPKLDEMADTAFDPLADWIMEKHALALEKGWDRNGFHFTLLVDEAYNVQTHAWINSKLMKILSECRPEVLNVFQTFQSIKNVNSDSRSRVSDWYLFTITLPGDLKRLEEFAMPEVIETVSHLREHEYIHFQNEKGIQNYEIVDEPDLWFVSLDYIEEKEMGREERPEFPLQFESEEDYWDFHAKHAERRGREKNTRDSGHRERSSDNSRRESGRRESGRRSNSGFTVYKKAS